MASSADRALESTRTSHARRLPDLTRRTLLAGSAVAAGLAGLGTATKALADHIGDHPTARRPPPEGAPTFSKQEVGLAFRNYGMPAEYALGAASWRAREWLGWNATLDEGAPADFVVYPRDPRADLSVLRQPAAIVLRGQLV